MCKRDSGRTLAKGLLAGAECQLRRQHPRKKGHPGSPRQSQGVQETVFLSNGSFSFKGLLLQHLHNSFPEVGSLGVIQAWGRRQAGQVCAQLLT